MSKNSNKMQNIVSLCKRRGFVYPGSEIYGGLSNSWNFGPLGAQLKKNIKDLWWQYFVVVRDDILGLDASLMMNPKVWEASGHIKGFTDPLVECKGCHQRYREDHILSSCPNCKSRDFTTPRQFNLMFKTFIGTVEDDASIVYLRPETAQAMFVDFKNIIDSTRVNIPFGIAQIGKSFRNEITPGNFIFRLLEFEQMEIEYFINPHSKNKRLDGWESYFKKWQKDMESWLEFIGIKKENWSIREHSKEELSHYSKKTIDFEYNFPFGTKELYGLAYRTDFDLSQHEKFSGKDLKYIDSKTGEKFIPHVIEPTFGVERTFLAVLCDAYFEAEGGREKARASSSYESKQEKEVILRLDKKLSPVKVAVFPLTKKDELIKKAKDDLLELKMSVGRLQNFVIAYDDNGSIGKRYRRQDEIGTPYCVTIDFQTLKDGSVTIRDRDTMDQERVSIKELKEFLLKQFNVFC